VALSGDRKWGGCENDIHIILPLVLIHQSTETMYGSCWLYLIRVPDLPHLGTFTSQVDVVDATSDLEVRWRRQIYFIQAERCFSVRDTWLNQTVGQAITRVERNLVLPRN
jgi:hypothetical protein